MRIDDRQLESILGGASTVSGTVINAFVNIIKVLLEAGEGVGSSIRRVVEKDICPLK